MQGQDQSIGGPDMAIPFLKKIFTTRRPPVNEKACIFYEQIYNTLGVPDHEVG